MDWTLAWPAHRKMANPLVSLGVLLRQSALLRATHGVAARLLRLTCTRRVCSADRNCSRATADRAESRHLPHSGVPLRICGGPRNREPHRHMRTVGLQRLCAFPLTPCACCAVADAAVLRRRRDASQPSDLPARRAIPRRERAGACCYGHIQIVHEQVHPCVHLPAGSTRTEHLRAHVRPH